MVAARRHDAGGALSRRAAGALRAQGAGPCRPALIRQAACGRTVLMVEHNLSVVSDICHEVTVLQRGEIIATGDYATVSRDPRVRTAYMGTED